MDVNTVHCWAIKSRDSGGNLNPNDQLLPERLVYCNSRIWTDKRLMNLLKQIGEYLGDPYCEKLKTLGLASVIEIVVGFITKILCSLGSTSTNVWNEESRTGNTSVIAFLLSCFKSEGNHFLYSIITGELGVSVWLGIEKPVTWISSRHFSQKEKKLKTQPSAGKCVFTFFWATEAYSQAVHGQGMRVNWD